MSERRGLAELADVYVLGLLDAAEAAEVEARAEHEADLRAAVGVARDRFLALDLTAPVAAVSDDLWARIAGGLAGAAPAPLPEPRPARRTDPRPTRGPVAKAAPADRAGMWRRNAYVGLAASCLLALALGWQIGSDRPQVIAVLMDADAQPIVLVEDFGGDRVLVTPLAALDVPAGRALQVWTKPDEATGPVSLGLLREVARATLSDPARPLPEPRHDQLYEITIEAEGGSPTGRPTGPIVVKGFARQPL